jgi:hypothetical protein
MKEKMNLNLQKNENPKTQKPNLEESEPNEELKE